MASCDGQKASDEAEPVTESRTLNDVVKETVELLRAVHSREEGKLKLQSASANQGADKSATNASDDKLIGFPPVELYCRAPHIPKKQWTLLGDLVSAREKRPCPETDNVYVPGKYWISLRLDGSGFSKYVAKMRREKVFPERGFSPEFAHIMQTCAQKLMERNKAYCAYTQSDEITVLIPATRLQPAKSDDEELEHYTHEYNGRVQKLVSQNAAYCASLFNHQIVQFYAKSLKAKKQASCKAEDAEPVSLSQPLAAWTASTTNEGGTAEDGRSEQTGSDLNDPTKTKVAYEYDSDLGFLTPADFLATFDCRIGSYASREEALALLLWRAYDCGVNGISDRIHHLKGDPLLKGDPELCKERSAAFAKSTFDKIVYLHKMGLFPLPDHQAYGSFYCAVKRMKKSIDPRNGREAPPTLRRTVEKVEGNVLDLFARGKLFPEDDEL